MRARAPNSDRARAHEARRPKPATPEAERWAVVQGRYRYALGRCWDPNLPRICWVMLNPSTANAREDDPTLRRVVGFSKAWGFGRLEVVNLFALRATDPRALGRVRDLVGPHNDRYLERAWGRAGTVVLAWGVPGAGRVQGRTVEVELAMRARGVVPWRLHPGTKKGHPRHPLYARGDSGLRQDPAPVPSLGLFQGQP